MQAGADAHVPLNETTQPEAGVPLAPIVTMPAVSVPATDGDVPQLDEQVGAVVCAVRSWFAVVPLLTLRFPVIARPELLNTPIVVAAARVAPVLMVKALLPDTSALTPPPKAPSVAPVSLP